MTKSAHIIEKDNMSPASRRVLKRVQKACKGAEITDCANALFTEYQDVLLMGCVDFEQYQRNVVTAMQSLELNGRAHFKRQN